jgi:protein-tyrosine-phosphatase
MTRKINFGVFVHPDKYLLYLSIEKIVADTKVQRRVIEFYKRKIVNGEDILPIVVIKNPGKDIYAVIDGHHRYYAYFELGVKDVNCAYAGDFSGLFFFMVSHGFFQPAVEIVVRAVVVPLVVHKNAKYYFGAVLKYLSFQKLRNFVLGVISTPMKWSTKEEDTKNEGSKFKVLFVCTANAYRSPICEALLKKLRPELMVDSAGTKIKIPNRITNEARKYLTKEDAIQYLKKTPESIDSKQVGQYDVIIVMEQEHKDIILKKYSECKNKIVVWDIHDKIPFLYRRTKEINRQMKRNVIAYSESLV